MMKLLADENFPLASIKLLSQAGYNIIGIGIDNHDISDEEVIQFAREEERLILTFDKDFGELIFKSGLKPDAGVIYLRWDEFKPEDPGKYLIHLFKSGDISFQGKLTVISGISIRQRKY